MSTLSAEQTTQRRGENRRSRRRAPVALLDRPVAGRPSGSSRRGRQTRYFPGSRRAVHHGRARYGEALSGSDLVVEFMQLVGAEVIFGIPGGASLPLNDAFTAAHEAGAFRYVLTGHEQGAAFEAAGYAGASGRAGFCTATSGPGATNLITGLADAFRDSRPVLAFTGNTPTTAEREAFQAIDIVGITAGKATKASYRPRRPEEVQALLVEAYHTAVSGRPGSVLFDLPKDVQVNSGPHAPLGGLPRRYDWTLPDADPDLVAEAARLLAGAQRPLLYVGHGAVLAGAARRGAPPQPAAGRPGGHHRARPRRPPRPQPAQPGHDRDARVDGGQHRRPPGGRRRRPRRPLRRSGRRGPPADLRRRGPRSIHVDVDATQLNRVRQVDVAIHGDVRQVTRLLLEAIPAGTGAGGEAGVDRAPWLAPPGGAAPGHAHRQLRRPARRRPSATSSSTASCPAPSARTAGRRPGGSARDVIATFDVGTHQMKGAQWFPVSRPRSFLTSGGMGSMGCALPMAVGAWFARPEATVFACVGDGGFVMSSHELDTIGGYGIPVKIVLFDDSLLGMVTNWHSLFFGGRKLTSDRRRGRPQEATDVAWLKEALLRRIGAAETADDLVGRRLRRHRASWPRGSGPSSPPPAPPTASRPSASTPRPSTAPPSAGPWPPPAPT